MIDYIAYFTALIVGFGLTFKVLRALEIEKYFKKGKVAEIHVAYFMTSLIVGHLLGEFTLTVINVFNNR